jgi:D-alanyl-D-alanine carboxypeptidase/D-alanyl-D-alanine-endopeptidase (penicillin-binding protein 4)
MRRGILLAAGLAAAAGPASATGDLLWHVETERGEVIDSRGADEPVNPASVLKIGTTIWALETLGADHRFVTRFAAAGAVEGGVLRGDLGVQGGGDPDFHPENAFLVAAALNGAGIARVAGRLIVGDRFWIGWEGGSGRRVLDPAARGRMMAGRLREAFDPARWSPPVRRAWQEFAERRGLDPARPPRIVVEGGTAHAPSPVGVTLLVEHRSKPLVVALRRFNCYSNNDIERIAEPLGGPAVLESWLEERLGASPDDLVLETASGLGRNRMTPRLVVRMLRELLRACDHAGLLPASLLPVGGCDPGTIEESFPRLTEGMYATAVAAKTGTLLNTDGGVAVLAGFARTLEGERLFCVAAPGSGRRLLEARAAEESWVVDLLAAGGGPHPRTCPPPLPMPDEGAEVRRGGVTSSR